MKILHMCSYYYSSSIYKNLFPEIEACDIEQVVYVPMDKNSKPDKLEKLPIRKGQFVLTKPYGIIDRLNYYSKIKKITKDVTSNVNLESIELVHAHSLFINGGVSYNIKKRKGIDYIVAVRSTDVDVFFKYFIHLRKLGIKILQNAVKIVFISKIYLDKVIDKYIPEDLKEDIINKSVVIPNGIDDFWIVNKHLKFKENDKTIKLIYVGRFIKRKNIPLSIAVTGKLISKGYDAKITVIGSGKLESAIKKLEHQNKNFVKVYNWMEGKEQLIKLYRDSDIFITPSHTETFGLVYLEAMSQGLPVIYTRNEGFDGLFSSGTVGYPVEINTDDIADKIIAIIGNYNKISKNCTNLVDKFNWNNIARQYVKIYEDYIEGCKYKC